MADITIQRGIYNVQQFTVTDTDTGLAVNLTGATIYFEVRTGYPGTTVVTSAGATISKTSAALGGITVTNAAGGVFEIEFTKANTNTLEPGIYIWGCEYTPSGSTEPLNIGSGNFVISNDVVRAV